MTDITRDEFDALRQLVNGKLSAAADSIDRLAATVERAPSKALTIGYGRNTYEPEEGQFIKAVMQAASRDAEEQAAGKAVLEGLSRYERNEKSTLGSTDATGGWIIPNAIVDDIVKPAAYAAPYMQLCTVVSGITTAAVDIPFRQAAPARAVIASWGSLKENVDLAYEGYTATMYTLARIHDLSKQLVQKSAGAAQRDVMSELGNAFARGIAYYAREGTGSGMPYGFITALNNAGGAFTSAHTAAANTVAGAVANAIGKASAALLGRGRTPTAAVMSATGYAEMVSNGKDEAGFYIAGLNANINSAFAPGTLVSPWGIPVYVDPDFPSDDLVVGDWKALKIYMGEGFRVDSSDVANTRWDYNLVGFRGELEVGFDFRPAVYAGCLQYVADILS